ncbi:MAG: NAD(P)-binding protein [Linnemannia elongata]|nr:MAG: NAD(P)-binding protein [Linnemannia elongata]
MPPVRVLSLEHVAAVLKDIDIEDILTSQAQAFHAYSANVTQTPERVLLESPYHKTLIMPSRIDTLTSAVKIVSVPKTDSKDGLPGVTIVLDNKTGEPRGLVNARLLTAVRTAAGSALATRVIFENKQEKKALSLAVFGSGAQAKAHIQLLTHILPGQISRIIICNRTLPRARDLVHELAPECSAKSIDISAFSITTGESTSSTTGSGSGSPQDKLKEIVQSAHIICTCTNTTEALFPGEWVQPGTHFNMVGSYTPAMHEIDQSLVARAWTLVDAKTECEQEAGEFILAKKLTGENGVLAELGEIFAEDGKFKREALPKEFSDREKNQDKEKMKDVTIFKSVGIAAQDVAITALVLDKAEAMGLGSVVDF